MTPHDYYNHHSREFLKSVSERAGTSFANFQQIALYNGHVSAALAERLAKASGYQMTEIEILYPSRFNPSAKSTA